MKNLIFGITLLIGTLASGFIIYSNSFTENKLTETTSPSTSCSCGEGCECEKGSECSCKGSCGSEGCKSGCGGSCMGSNCMKK